MSEQEKHEFKWSDEWWKTLIWLFWFQGLAQTRILVQSVFNEFPQHRQRKVRVNAHYPLPLSALRVAPINLSSAIKPPQKKSKKHYTAN